MKSSIVDKYRNKYRIPSARAEWWDYAWAAAYFITICTKNMECVFGDICNDNLNCSVLGRIADSCWKELPKHARNLQLGEHVIMPNHVHGILILDGNPAPNKSLWSTSCALFAPVETRPALSPLTPPAENANDKERKNPGQLRRGHPGKNTISTIVGGYKSAVTKAIHKQGYQFEWQSRFHDHIIRDEEEYHRITEYILENPFKWKTDKLHPGSRMRS